MNRDLYLSGVKAHAKRMEDWREREITPKWLDWVIVVCALAVIVCVALWRGDCQLPISSLTTCEAALSTAGGAQ